MIRKFKKFAAQYGVVVLTVLMTLLVVGLILLPRLGGLVPTNSERAHIIGVSTRDQLLEQVAFLPQKVVQFGLHKIDEGNVTLLRASSVLIVVISLVALFSVLSKWHTKRVAFASCFLFITSSYVLHDARDANQQVAYLAVIPLLLLVGTWLKSKRNVKKLPIAAFLVALLLYSPGVWLLVGASAIVFRKRLLLAWRFVGTRLQLATILMFFGPLLPLFFAVFKYPNQVVALAGYSNDLTLLQICKNLITIPADIFINGPNTPGTWVVGTPIVDIFTATMFLLGLIAYTRGHHPLRMRLLVGYLVLSSLLVALGIATLGLIVPVIYIFAANGIANMLQSWFVVFPRNPIARNIGLVIIIAAVLLTARYHVIRYYDAWPSIKATQSTLSVVQ
jgi:hypothetical protein